MRFIDQEIKKLITTLIIAILFILVLVWAARNTSSITATFNNFYYSITAQKTYSQSYSNNLKNDKSYFLTIKSNKGDMKFALYKDKAPSTVNNLVNLVRDDFYKYLIFTEKTDKYILFGNNPAVETKYKIQEEINANSLNLDKITVAQDYDMLKSIYDQRLLDANKDKSLKDFYSYIGYKYNDSLSSNIIKKGSLVMYSEVPGGFNYKFFISSYGELPQYDGRMTNFGEIISGQDTLDKINNSKADDVKIQSIEIEEK